MQLSVFLNSRPSDRTKSEVSPEMRKYNKYNLLYVVQSKADRATSVYKIGVSKGVGRLNEYVKMHGMPTDPRQKAACAGSYLVYLAGTLRTDAASRETTQGKIDAEIVNSYKNANSVWSRRKEKSIFESLQLKGMKPVRGKEWYLVPGAKEKSELKRVVVQSLGEATRESEAHHEQSIAVTNKDKIMSVTSRSMGQTGENKGEWVHYLKWNRPFSRKDKAGKTHHDEPVTLKGLYARKKYFNANGMTHGSRGIALVHAWLADHPRLKDPSQRRSTRSS